MTFEQVVDEEEAALANANVGVTTSPSEFARDYLASRPSGYGGHRCVPHTIPALDIYCCSYRIPTSLSQNIMNFCIHV